MLTVMLFLPVGEIFYVQTIIRIKALYHISLGVCLHTTYTPHYTGRHPPWKPGVLGKEKVDVSGTGLFYTIVAAFRETTFLAPVGEPHDGQALYLSQEQAGKEEGKMK